jgi:hypothetical protein
MAVSGRWGPGRDAAVRIRGFVGAKASGLVARAIEKTGARGVSGRSKAPDCSKSPPAVGPARLRFGGAALISARAGRRPFHRHIADRHDSDDVTTAADDGKPANGLAHKAYRLLHWPWARWW